MMITAVVLGTVTAVMGTGRVTLSLVASGTVMWAFVPTLQLLTGLLLIGASGTHAPSLRGYFETGRPWLLWLLALGLVFLVAPDPGPYFLPLIATIVVPFVLTARALRRIAPRRAVLLHQAVTVGLLLGYIGWAIGGWARVVGLLRGA